MCHLASLRASDVSNIRYIYPTSYQLFPMREIKTEIKEIEKESKLHISEFPKAEMLQ